MRNLARNLLGTQSDAEDAVQETFLKVQRGIGSFRGQSSFVTWTISNPGKHLPRFAPQPDATEGTGERRDGGV